MRFTLPQSGPYRFCANKCDYENWELPKGRAPLTALENHFEKYKNFVNKPDLILYRRFYRKWWQAWNWYDFLTHPRWKYPYAERDEDT